MSRRRVADKNQIGRKKPAIFCCFFSLALFVLLVAVTRVDDDDEIDHSNNGVSVASSSLFTRPKEKAC